jgi:hypothetical protein
MVTVTEHFSEQYLTTTFRATSRVNGVKLVGTGRTREESLAQHQILVNEMSEGKLDAFLTAKEGN